MRIMIRPSHFKVKMIYLLAKWETFITFLTILCAIFAMFTGTIWLFYKKTILLYICIGFSSCYFVGKKVWRYRYDLI